MSETVLAEAVLAFGDVRRGDKILVDRDRAEVLARYLKVIGDVEVASDIAVIPATVHEEASTVAPATLGEPELSFFEQEEAANDQGGHLPAED
jgi:hypothetical protein